MLNALEVFTTVVVGLMVGVEFSEIGRESCRERV